jgi:sugar/nucleoside kinase (ribokinase family)
LNTPSAPIRVATVGVHILDTLGTPVSYLPDGQNSLRIDQIRVTPGGTAAGVAVDLATLGASVSTVGAVGDDEAGEFLVAALARRGVDTTRIVRLGGVQTSASILLVRENGDRPALHVRGANAQVTWDDLDLSGLRDCAGFHFGGFDAMAALGVGRSAEMIRTARSGGAMVSMDFQSAARYLAPELLTLLPEVDVFLPNQEQAAGLVGADEPVEIVERLLARGAKSVVVTCGADGAVYGDGTQILRTPAYPVEVVDTTGCGDSFSSAFLLSTLKGYPPADALRLASAAAGLVATGLGSDAGLRSWAHLVEFAGAS